MGQSDRAIDQALEIIGQVIDTAFDTQSAAGTDHAFDLIQKLEQQELSPEQSALLHYYRSNAWENRLHEGRRTDSWDWDIPQAQNQIIELRRCINHAGFSSFDTIRQCQVLTNLGNKLNFVGRCIEAIEIWDRVLKIEKYFAMALGNKGIGLSYYGRSLYDPGHAAILLYYAWNSYKCADSRDAFFDAPGNDYLRDRFTHELNMIAEHVDIPQTEKLIKAYEANFGESEPERHYRKWVLQTRLFLNPLNDAGTLPIATHDVLTLPSITTGMDSKEGRPPSIIGFYNQLKQEFVSARWLLFEALQGDESHFSDKDVLLYNTLEYPMYGLSVEKMRSAYRVAYSLLDKTAYFLNHYFALGHPDRTVNFRNVWYQPKTMGQKVLHDELAGRENWPLRGLFWLSKDIFEPDIKGVTEPDAQALYDIRNHLEHKYLQVVETVFESLVPVPDGEHVLGYRISWADFRSKTTRIFKLARASLIYLSLAVHKEEKRREQERSAHTVMPMPLATWSDEWKQ